MNHTVIKSSQLGTNCWLPYRVLGTCYKCQQKEKEIWNYKVLLGLPVSEKGEK